MWLIITVNIAILQWAHAQSLPTVPINNDYNAPPMDYNAPPMDYNAPPMDYNAPPMEYNVPPIDYNAPPIDYNDYNTLTTVPIDYFNGKYNLNWTPEYHCP